MTRKEKVVGYGYVGRWRDGKLGCGVPSRIAAEFGKHPAWNVGTSGNPIEKLELCKITIEPVLSKTGRKIVRRMK